MIVGWSFGAQVSGSSWTTERAPDGEVCHCPCSEWEHRHIGNSAEYYNSKFIPEWRDLSIEEQRKRLLKEIFG